MHKKLTACTTALIAAVTFAATPAHAEGRLEKIKSTGEIAIGHRDTSIPFSYLDDKQNPIGYSLDICMGVIEALKKKLDMPEIKVKYVPVTSSTRIPLVANGTVDLNCGSSTNTIERQAQVAFAPTTFITATRFLALKSSKVEKLDDFKGKTIVSTAGTSNIRWATGANNEQKLGMNIISTKDHAEAMLTVENGRALAFFMDDILLAGLVATSRNPDAWMISKDAYTIEPYAIMQPKDDPEFKKVVDDAIIAMMKDGTIEKLYAKWFESPIPPKNVTLNWPMTEQLKRTLQNPSDSADPEHYK
ncbi:amino acid ABC transporter substrate-binding protein [Paracandidimonas soli]|uniref:Amino acid ABC transporter substrate-binding protein (PAAT family) n=1 Tax=Paracandidimonas soli TaxID=1917182 RepID=A0A4R3V6J4_9BURK|nr:amino acid ABC transporter substrate-binding protein [Paracandidimonas soli]TCU98978.1 amino acid ABC transporter substrate-binding protein (PAAT family) [Paracandidimonas soli]